VRNPNAGELVASYAGDLLVGTLGGFFILSSTGTAAGTAWARMGGRGSVRVGSHWSMIDAYYLLRLFAPKAHLNGGMISRH
jgi:hypothetical protein